MSYDYLLLLNRARLDKLDLLLNAIRQVVLVKFLVINNQILTIVNWVRVHV